MSRKKKRGGGEGGVSSFPLSFGLQYSGGKKKTASCLARFRGQGKKRGRLSQSSLESSDREKKGGERDRMRLFGRVGIGGGKKKRKKVGKTLIFNSSMGGVAEKKKTLGVVCRRSPEGGKEGKKSLLLSYYHLDEGGKPEGGREE